MFRYSYSCWGIQINHHSVSRWKSGCLTSWRWCAGRAEGCLHVRRIYDFRSGLLPFVWLLPFASVYVCFFMSVLSSLFFFIIGIWQPWNKFNVFNHQWKFFPVNIEWLMAECISVKCELDPLFVMPVIVETVPHTVINSTVVQIGKQSRSLDWRLNKEHALFDMEPY